MMSLDLAEVSQCVLPGNNRNENYFKRHNIREVMDDELSQKYA